MDAFDGFFRVALFPADGGFVLRGQQLGFGKIPLRGGLNDPDGLFAQPVLQHLHLHRGPCEPKLFDMEICEYPVAVRPALRRGNQLQFFVKPHRIRMDADDARHFRCIIGVHGHTSPWYDKGSNNPGVIVED